MRPTLAAAALVLTTAAGSAAAQADDAAAAKAFDIASLRRELESAVGLVRALTVQANQSTLREGEALVLTIVLPRAGHLNVISIDPSGAPTVLFPNQFTADNAVQPGRFTLPTPQMPFELKTSAPFGESRIVAFLSTKPLNLYTDGGQRNAAGALDRFARLSTAGRDLLNLVVNGGLQRDAQAGEVTAGVVTVLSCASAGPCTGTSEVPGGVRRIVDAIVPGIFLDKDVDIPQPKGGLPLRPVYEPGIRLTKVSEGFMPRLYHDAAGYCTIAYGHLMRLDGCNDSDRRRYRNGISEPNGALLLVGDLARAQRAVSAFVEIELSDGQYAALVDLTYNIGAGNFKRSTLLRAVNAKQFERVPAQLRRWTRAGGKEYRGLRIRREREILLFLEGLSLSKAPPPDDDTTPIDIRTGEPGR